MAKKILKVLSIIVSAILLAGSIFIISVSINFRVNYEISVCNQYSMLTEINLDLYLQNYKYVSGEEAKNTTQPGDYAILDKKSKNYKVGDIVSAHINWPNVGEDSIVKRLVGLPGDYIKIKERLVENNVYYDLFVNNQIIYTKQQKQFIGKSKVEGEQNKDIYLDNTSTYNSFITFTNSTSAIANGNVKEDSEGDLCIVLKPDEYFLLGDNWQDSYDCMDVLKPISGKNLGYKVVGIVKYNAYNKWTAIKCSVKLMFKKHCW